MWELLNSIFQNYGLSILVHFLELGAVTYLFFLSQRRQREIVILYEKRLRDVSESKEDYSELAHKLDQSIDLLIKVFKRNGG